MGVFYEQVLIQHAIHNGEGCYICGYPTQDEESGLLSYSFQTNQIVHRKCLEQKMKEPDVIIRTMAREFGFVN